MCTNEILNVGLGEPDLIVDDVQGEDAKGINERFIDLNKASEGAPKISKPSYGSQALKSSDFSSSKGTNQGHRIGD